MEFENYHANMQAPTREQLSELQATIGKLSLPALCSHVLPSLGLRWQEVSAVVQDARLPLTPASVARVLKMRLAETCTREELARLIKQLNIKLVAVSQSRVWRALRLLEPVADPESAEAWARELRGRVKRAANRAVRDGGRVKVYTEKIGDLVFLSLQKVRAARAGNPLYVAVAASQPVAFVTKLGGSLVQAAVEGLGYAKYVDAELYGRDLSSLLRVLDREWNVAAQQLTEPPQYDPRPVLTQNGIDYTHQTYNEAYVDQMLGPEPPLLNNLDIKSEKPFFDSSRLNKTMTVTMSLKSEDVAQTLRTWVSVKAIPPTSELIKIFHHLRSNKFTYNREEE